VERLVRKPPLNELEEREEKSGGESYLATAG
jgi:hypothetical protein